jgi:hypothetical protein
MSLDESNAESAIGTDLVVVAMQDQSWHVEFRQILGPFRKCLDANDGRIKSENPDGSDFGA